jgi:ribosome production factor 1
MQTPKTIDNMREMDDTVVAPDDEEVLRDEADDEFAEYYDNTKQAKLMITTQQSPSGKIYRLVAEFMAVIPNCSFYKRSEFCTPVSYQCVSSNIVV